MFQKNYIKNYTFTFLAGQRHYRHSWNQRIGLPKELNPNDITVTSVSKNEIKVQISLMKRFKTVQKFFIEV